MLSSQAVMFLRSPESVKRFIRFLEEKEGWYFNNLGLPLSKKAVNYFNYFCIVLGDRIKPGPVSVFMGIEGNLEISWHDKDNNLFNVDFFDDKIEFYFEKINSESLIVEPNIFEGIICLVTKIIEIYKELK